MKLVFIHPDAKAGRSVSVPGINDAPIAYGAQVEWPDDMADRALATGHWEIPRQPKPKKEAD